MKYATLFALLFVLPPVHDGPDPIGSWRLSKEQVRDGKLQAMLGVAGRVEGEVEFIEDPGGTALYFDGKTTRVMLAADFAKAQQKLPKRHLTIDAWVSINTPTRWGGILSVMQDNGNAEQGWVLGYNGSNFTFGLATTGTDDGDGSMTYLAGKTKYEEGRYYHVAATYDGESQKIYVNGALDGESRTQSGDILYPKSAPFVLGGYLDKDEDVRFHGRIRSVRLFDQTAKAKVIAHSYQHNASLTKQTPYTWIDPEHRWVVEPYLQWATQDGMTVRWETSRPSSSRVEFSQHVTFQGKGAERRGMFDRERVTDGMSKLHSVRIDGLEADTAYYYRVESTDDLGRTLQSGILSFQTACGEGTPFAFAVISDTQGNPKVSGAMARFAWALRPSFLLHPGDLVSTGAVKEQWVDQFFRSMKPLLERVALFPVLGNHEGDARHYYDYMSLPDPEYYYTFNYGNAQFFMIDSNRQVRPGSEQYRFLETELSKSKAEWKIVCYHHPAYSSDENDYGNSWYGPSTRGDLRVRALVPLYDKYGVDIVWNGHIHSYERTWPLRKSAATSPHGGTVYMITGGGGGGLETPGPIRPFFQNTVRRGHHFCFVTVNGKTLEMKAFDLEGQLFDVLKIEKR